MSIPPDSAGKQPSIGAKAELNAAAIARWDDEGGASKAPEPQDRHPKREVLPTLLTGLAVDEGPHSMDGMLLHARHESENVKAFISRRVTDIWVEPIEPSGRRIFIAYNTTLSASKISPRLSESLPPNTSAVLDSTVSTRLWISCTQTSSKAARRWTSVSCYAKRHPDQIRGTLAHENLYPPALWKV